MYQRTTPLLQKARPISSVGLMRPGTPSYSWRVYKSQNPRAMIQSPAGVFRQDTTLGFSLNPFTLIRKAVSVVKSALKGSTVTLPSPAGPIAVPVSSLPDTIRGSSIQFGTTAPGPLQQVGAAVESIPGGWATIAAVGAGAIVIGMAMSRRR